MRAGQTLAGRYRLSRALGRGGMGVVWEATGVTTSESVAIKVINHGDLGETEDTDTSMLSRFEREAAAVRAIDSPHVVRIIDSGTDEETGAPFMVMERLVGEDLSTLLRRDGPLSVDSVVRIAMQVCAGLRSAHACGIVHRDIKPANIFLAKSHDPHNDEVTVKILDFGIAKVKMDTLHATKTGLTKTGGLLGSPQYMSPEQAQGLKNVDHRTDLWSLGVVMYKCLVGRTPHWDLEAFGQLILRICLHPASPIREHAPWVDPETAAIIHKALKIEKSARFQSAEEMLEAIQLVAGPSRPLHLASVRALPASQQAMLRVPVTKNSQMSVSGAAIDVDLGATLAGPSSPDPQDETSILTEGGLITAEPQRRSSKRTMLVAGGTLAIAAAIFFGVGRRAQMQASRPAAPAEPIAAAAPAASSPTAPAVRSVSLEVVPANAEVDVDGVPVRVASGLAPIEGPLGSKHNVRLRVGKSEKTFLVVIADDGAVPPQVVLVELAAGKRPAASGRGSGSSAGLATSRAATASAAAAPAHPSPPAAPHPTATATPPPPDDGFRRFD